MEYQHGTVAVRDNGLHRAILTFVAPVGGDETKRVVSRPAVILAVAVVRHPFRNCP